MAIASIGAKRKKAGSRTRKAKPGAKKRKSRVSAVGAVAEKPETIAIAGVKFKKTTCHKTKTQAAAAAGKMRTSGKRARVIQSGTGFCVYSRGRAKKAA